MSRMKLFRAPSNCDLVVILLKEMLNYGIKSFFEEQQT